MKKLLSILLSLMMIVGVSSSLVTTVGAATDSTQIKTWNFDNTTGTGTTLINNLGWSILTNNQSNLTATISEGTLHLQNSAASRIYMQVCQDEALMGEYTIEYDFKYAPASGNYNSDTDEAGFFIGDTGTSSAGTWQVQPRLYGQLLNAPKSDADGWLNATRMKSNRFGTLSGGIVTNQWFTVRIDYSPNNVVTASIKAKGASSWLLTDTYSVDQISDSCGTKGFITEYLRFCLASYVDIYLDNITVSTPDYTPQIYGVQYRDTESVYDMRIVATIKDKESTKVGFRVFVRFFDESAGVTRTAMKDIECNYVYQSITFQDGGGSVTKTAGQLREDMTYLYALHIEGIPKDETYSYLIIPYEVRGGETVYGPAKSLDRSLAKEMLPDYDTESGTVNDFIEFCIGGYFTRQIVGTDPDEFNAYVAKLINAGYTSYQSRNANGNYFHTLYNGFMMVHLYYMPDENTAGDFTKDVVRIVVSDTPLSEAFPKTPYGDAKVTDAVATFMSVDYDAQPNPGNGLGMVFTNPDGSYVIMDGAWKYDTSALYNYMKDNNKREDGKILIRAWIITHPHEDHWGNFIEFANRYAGEKGYDELTYDYSDVEVEYFVAQLNQQYCNANTQVFNGSNLIRQAAAKLGAETIVPQTGQVMYFGQLEVEFLYTLETLLNPNSVQSYLTGVDGNEQSLMFRCKFHGGDQSVLVTGDATQNESEHMDIMYYRHLRSDIVTLPHHGLDATTTRFYEDSIQPKYVLVATSTSHTANRLNQSTSQNRVGGIHKAVAYAESVGGAYYAADGEYASNPGDWRSYRHFLIGHSYLVGGSYATQKDSMSLSDFFAN